MKKEYKRHNFAFSPELDKLIRRLSEETELKLVTIIKKSVEMFAEKHDHDKNGK